MLLAKIVNAEPFMEAGSDLMLRAEAIREEGCICAKPTKHMAQYIW